MPAPQSTPEKSETPVVPEAESDSSSAELINAIQAGDLETMSEAWDRLNQSSPDEAAATIQAISQSGLAEQLLEAFVQMSVSVSTVDAARRAAEVAFALGNQTVAGTAARETLQRDPQNVPATYILAVLANRQGEADKALSVINELIALRPESKTEPNLALQFAVAQLGSNNPQGALDTIDGQIDNFAGAGLAFDAQVVRARALQALPDRNDAALLAWTAALAVATPDQANAIRYAYAASLRMAKRYDEALAELDLAVKETSDKPTLALLHAARANDFFNNGKLDDAIRAIEDQLAVVSKPDERLALRLSQAQIAVVRKEWKDAADRFDSALAEVPQEDPQKRHDVHLAKAQALATHDYELVTADLDELDKAPIGDVWPPAFDARIGGLLTAGRVEEAQAWLNSRLAASPQLADHPAAHQVRAEIQMKLGNAEAAIEQYSQAMAISPGRTDPRAWGAALVGAIATQQWDKATALYEQFFKTNPEAIDAPTRVFVAVAYARGNEPETALELTDQEELLPPHIAALRRQARAEAQMRLERYDAVLKTIDDDLLKGAETAPDALLAIQLIRIQALNQLQRFAEARSAATHALDSFTDLPASLSGLMQVLRLSVLVQRSLSCYSLEKFAEAHADIDEAISTFEKVRSSPAVKVLEKAPDFSSLESSMWFAKGAVLQEENRGDESLTAYTRAFALETKGAAAAIARGKALTNIETFTDAVIAFDIALSRVNTAKERATALAGKGLALVRLQRYEQAMTVLRAAVDARLTERSDDPIVAAANAAVFENLGVAYNALGRNGAALNAFDRAWKLTKEEKRDRSKANVARGISAAHLKMENPATALEFFDTLQKDLRTEPTMMFNCALALDATGKRTEAIKLLVQAKRLGLREAQELLNRLDPPNGLNRWTRDWLGVQVSSARRAFGIALLVIAGVGLAAPFYQWWLTSKLDWYWLLIPSVAALMLFALPSLRSIKAAGVELSAEPLPATGRDASTSPTLNLPTNLPTITAPIAPK